MRRSWSDLPEQALISINQFNNSRFDTIRIRAVCSNWRRNVPPPPKPSNKLPMLLYSYNSHPLIKGHNLSVYKLYKTTVVLFEEPESSAKWLASISERSFANKVCLLNPFTSRALGKYFPKYAFPNRILDLLDFRITQVSSRYNMRLIGVMDEDNNRESQNLEIDFKLVNESKLEYDDCHKAQLWDEYSKNDSFYIITHLSKLRNVSLASEEWSEVGDREADYCDVTVHNDFFFFVDRSGEVICIHCCLNEIEQVIRPPLSFVGEWYLVKAGGDLYLVGRDFRVCDRQVYYSDEAHCFVAKSRSGSIPVVFHIFVLNCEDPLEPKWVEVPSLGGYIFILSRDASFAIEAAACNLSEGNSIIFVDEIKYEDDGGGVKGGGGARHNVPQENKYAIKELGGVKVGVYNVVEGINMPISQCPDQFHLFWPPPEWLAMMSSCSCSSPSSSSSSSSSSS